MFDLQRIAALIPGQWERVIATVLLLAGGFLVSQLWAHYLGRGDVLAERRRLHPTHRRSGGGCLPHIEAAATAVAVEATKAWQTQAEAHFRQVADQSFVELPTGRIRVFWDFADPERLLLCVRLACPEKMRLEVGQEIFKATWRAIAAVMPIRDNDRQAVREP